MRLKLVVESIPISTWGVTLASRLPRKEWDEIRQRVYREANYTCQICGNINDTLFCHEQWKWDDRRKIQKLVGFECCCKLCSDVHHFGRSTQVYGKAYVEKLISHWCKVNDRKREDFILSERKRFELNKRRANIFYVVKVGRRILV